MSQDKRINLVLEGGGVKGIALVGALEVFENEGYKWEYLAGTSAGAIVATLLGVGKSVSEIKDIMDGIDYKKVKDNSGFAKLPIIGPLWNFVRKKGLYDGNWIEEKIRNVILSGPEPKETFGDLDPPNKLTLMTTDISTKRSVAFPHDFGKWMDAKGIDIAFAMRCSMSFPGFFVPKQLQLPPNMGAIHYFMDGGMLSNFPYWYLEKAIPQAKQFPTIGLQLDEGNERVIRSIKGIADIFKAMVATLLSPLDQRNFENPNYQKRIVKIDVSGVDTLDFNISKEQQEKLYQNGQEAATRFLKVFDYDAAVAEGSPFAITEEAVLDSEKKADRLSQINKDVRDEVQKHTFVDDDLELQKIRFQFAVDTVLILENGLDDSAAELIWTAGVQAYNGSLSYELNPDLANQHIDELNALKRYLSAKILQADDEGGKINASQYLGINISNMLSSIKHRASIAETS